MLPLLPILSALATLGASLAMVVLLIASRADCPRTRVRQRWIFTWSVLVITVLGLVAAAWAFAKAHYGLAAGVAIVPAIYCAALTGWMLVTEW